MTGTNLVFGLTFGLNKLMNISIIAFRIFGVWPNSSMVYKVAAYLFHTLFSTGWTVAKCIGTAMLDKRSELILQGPSTLYCAMSVIRIFIAMYNSKRIKRSFDQITEFQLHNETEAEDVGRNIKIFSRNSFAYVVFLCSAMGSSLVTPVFEKDRVLPLPIWFPLDWEHNLLYYWIGYLFSFLGIMSLVVMDVFLPIFIWFLMYANALKFRLLGARIATLGYKTGEGKIFPKHGMEDQKNAFRQLCGYIKIHKNISTEVTHIQDIFSMTFLIQITSSAICICSVTYLMATENLFDNVNNFVKYICLMGIYTYEIFMLMYYGNEVMLASEDLLTNVYESNWMDLYRKIALIFMERLKRPQEMKIGKVFPLNLKMMTSILNVTYSCLNVLRSSEQGKSY